MTESEAIMEAKKRSTEGFMGHPVRTIFVVCEPQEDGTMFDTATEYDLDTYYLGAPVVYAFHNGVLED